MSNQTKAANPVVLSENRDGIAHIRLNRPDVLNAINGVVCSELKAALSAAEGDATVGAILLSGAGRAFCAGGDLDEIRQLCKADADALQARISKDFAAVQQVYNCPKPTVAAVQGAVFGGGAGLAGACDFIVAEEGTKFGFPFIDLGLIPDMTILFSLSQRVGLPAARRLLLRGKTILAEEAADLGFVDELAAKGTLMESAEALARELAARNGPAMQFTRAHLNQISTMSFERSMEKEILSQCLLWQTPLVRERSAAMIRQLSRKTRTKEQEN